MLDRGRQFYPRCLLLRALGSEATRQVTSFLASRLNESYEGCVAIKLVNDHYFSLLFSEYIHKFGLLKIFVSFQVSDVLCTCKRSERAKRTHSLYFLNFYFITLN